MKSNEVLNLACDLLKDIRGHNERIMDISKFKEILETGGIYDLSTINQTIDELLTAIELDPDQPLIGSDQEPDEDDIFDIHDGWVSREDLIEQAKEYANNDVSWNKLNALDIYWNKVVDYILEEIYGPKIEKEEKDTENIKQGQQNEEWWRPLPAMTQIKGDYTILWMPQFKTDIPDGGLYYDPYAGEVNKHAKYYTVEDLIELSINEGAYLPPNIKVEGIEIEPRITKNKEIIWLPKNKKDVPNEGISMSPFDGDQGVRGRYSLSELEQIARENGVDW